MKKITLRFTEEEITQFNEIKQLMYEKTYNKAITKLFTSYLNNYQKVVDEYDALYDQYKALAYEHKEIVNASESVLFYQRKFSNARRSSRVLLSKINGQKRIFFPGTKKSRYNL